MDLELEWVVFQLLPLNDVHANRSEKKKRKRKSRKKENTNKTTHTLIALGVGEQPRECDIRFVEREISWKSVWRKYCYWTGVVFRVQRLHHTCWKEIRKSFCAIGVGERFKENFTKYTRRSRSQRRKLLHFKVKFS